MAKKNRLPNGLTQSQEEFCQQFIIDLDAAAAAKRAEYAVPAVAGCKLLKVEKVQKRIMELKRSRMHRTMVTQDEVLIQWADIGLFDIRELYHEDGRMKLPHELSAVAAQVVASAKVKQVKKRTYHSGDEDDEVTEVYVDEVVEYKLNDKHTALTNMAKHLGLLDKEDAVGELTKSFTEIMDRLAPTVGPTSELTSVKPDSDTQH